MNGMARSLVSSPSGRAFQRAGSQRSVGRAPSVPPRPPRSPRKVGDPAGRERQGGHEHEQEDRGGERLLGEHLPQAAQRLGAVAAQPPLELVGEARVVGHPCGGGYGCPGSDGTTFLFMRLAATASASALTLGLLLAGCGSDASEAEAAQKEVCRDSGEVKDNLDALANAIADGNQEDAEEAYNDLTASVLELNGGMEDLNEARRDEIQPQVEAIQTAVEDVDVSDLSTLGTSIDAIKTSVTEAADTISSTSSLDC